MEKHSMNSCKVILLGSMPSGRAMERSTYTLNLFISTDFPAYSALTVKSIEGATSVSAFCFAASSATFIIAASGEAIRNDSLMSSSVAASPSCLEIESISSLKDTIKILDQEKKGNRYKLDLQIIPPEAKGKSRVFTDKVVVNIKGGEKVEFMCRGFYEK